MKHQRKEIATQRRFFQKIINFFAITEIAKLKTVHSESTPKIERRKERATQTIEILMTMNLEL